MFAGCSPFRSSDALRRTKTPSTESQDSPRERQDGPRRAWGRGRGGGRRWLLCLVLCLLLWFLSHRWLWRWRPWRCPFWRWRRWRLRWRWVCLLWGWRGCLLWLWLWRRCLLWGRHRRSCRPWHRRCWLPRWLRGLGLDRLRRWRRLSGGLCCCGRLLSKKEEGDAEEEEAEASVRVPDAELPPTLRRAFADLLPQLPTSCGMGDLKCAAYWPSGGALVATTRPYS